MQVIMDTGFQCDNMFFFFWQFITIIPISSFLIHVNSITGKYRGCVCLLNQENLKVCFLFNCHLTFKICLQYFFSPENGYTLTIKHSKRIHWKQQIVFPYRLLTYMYGLTSKRNVTHFMLCGYKLLLDFKRNQFISINKKHEHSSNLIIMLTSIYLSTKKSLKTNTSLKKTLHAILKYCNSF